MTATPCFGDGEAGGGGEAAANCTLDEKMLRSSSRSARSRGARLPAVAAAGPSITKSDISIQAEPAKSNQHNRVAGTQTKPVE